MSNDSRTVLVVEDDKPFRQLIERWLEEHDFSVLTAVDGMQGMKKIEGDPVDLVILDIILPGASGITFLKDLNDLPESNRPAVVVVSALDEKTVKERIGDAEYDEFLGKPCDMDDVEDVIQKFLPVNNDEPGSSPEQSR